MDGGDRLGELYEQHVHAAYRLGFFLTGDRELASDLVQDAFVRLISRFRHLGSPERFDQYLRRTIVNLAASHFRHRSVERRYLAGPQGPRNVDQAFPDIETRETLWLQLQRLPARQRAALVLRYYEDLSEEQTGVILGISARAVNALMSRALETLRKKEGEHDGTRR